MNRSRRVWDELLRAIEEALAEFSGVSPDLIVHWPAIPEKTLPGEWQAPPVVAPSPVCARKNTAEKLNKER
jgi:hypothetical protein